MAAIKRLQVATRYSEAAIFNGVVYLAGQVPNDATQDIQGQTAQVLAMIDDLLAQSGSSKNHLLSVTIYSQRNKDKVRFTIYGLLPRLPTTDTQQT
jgi:enamine deaminase RidA (YjgF/YER057c/UK114 family)